MKSCTFKGKKYYLITWQENDSPLATKEQFENGWCPFAHVYKNRGVLRYGEKIGEVSDLKNIKDCKELEPKVDVLNLMDNFLGGGFGW